MNSRVRDILVFLCIVLIGMWLQTREDRGDAAPSDDFLEFVKVRVIDGDSLLGISRNRKETRLRLVGIDAPERGQPFGGKARDVLSKLITNNEILYYSHGSDRYERTLVQPLIANTEEKITMKLVSEGLAWCLHNAPRECKHLERESREEGRGLWAVPDPLPPWEWRKRKKD